MKLPLKGYWDLLSKHIRPQRWRFALLAGLLLGSIGLQILNPQIMRLLIDQALGGQAASRLAIAAAAFIGIALLQQVVSVGVTYLGESVAWTATNALRAELAWHCLNLDMSFHNNHSPGELIERIDGDVSEMANFFSQFVVMLVGNLLLLVGVLAVLFREDWRAGLAFTIYAAVALWVLNRVRDIAVPHQKDRRQAEADLFGFLEEQLAGTEDIRSNGAVGFSLRELFRLQAAILHHNRKASYKEWTIGVVMGGILILGNILSIFTGYILYRTGAISVGTVYLFVHYINLLEGPIWTLTHQMQSFQTIGACVERLGDLRKIQSTVQDGAGARLAEGAIGLAFEGVTFKYKDGNGKAAEVQGDRPVGETADASSQHKNGEREYVLRDVTLRLRPGRVLGLLGRTGSGKTTLARLVFRLYDPDEGTIRLDGADLRQAPLQALRQRVALVTQDVQIFQASMRDNLTFFNSDISDDTIWKALETLDLADWVRSLPQGLDTSLQAGGRSLSAGEAQLLALARVFLRDPGLVILDEASSRLDPATEARLERAVDRLLDGRTAIIIAHRLHTVHRADEVLILDEGQVGEWGEREALARQPDSRFYHLLQTGLEEVLV